MIRVGVTLVVALLMLCSGCAADLGLLVIEHAPDLRPRPVCPAGVEPAAVTWCRVEK